MRNIAVALGNAPSSDKIIDALQTKLLSSDSEMLNEHIQWALAEHATQISIVEQTNEDRLNKRLIRAIEKGLPRDA